MSISGLAMISRPSVTILTLSPTTRFARSTSRSATIVISMARPARRRISSWLLVRTLYVPEPTVPMPSRPTWIGFIEVSLQYGLHSSRLAPRKVFSSRGNHVVDDAGNLPRATGLHAPAQSAGRGVGLLEPEPVPGPRLDAAAVAGRRGVRASDQRAAVEVGGRIGDRP